MEKVLRLWLGLVGESAVLIINACHGQRDRSDSSAICLPFLLQPNDS